MADPCSRAVRHRVLIVTSSYAPAMVADMQRSRQLAWTLPSYGWDVELLSPDHALQNPVVLEADGAAFFYAGAVVHTVREWLPGIFRAAGLRSIGWRALLPMAVSGFKLLRRRQYDVIYISTANFPLFLLAVLWAPLGIPIVLDFHDPCRRADRGLPIWAKRNFRNHLSLQLNALIETASVRRAAAIVSVSPHYLIDLRNRYAGRSFDWDALDRAVVIPFGAMQRDLKLVSETAAKAGDGKEEVRIVYVGVGGPVMAKAFTLLCRTLQSLNNEDRTALSGLRIELYGTELGWRPGMSRYLADIAQRFGVAEWVHEDPARISYRRSLELLLGADGALILGVDDAGYVPSKLYSYAASAKPLLALLRRNGAVDDHFKQAPELGQVIWFDTDTDMPVVDAGEQLRTFLGLSRARRHIDRPVVRRFSAEAAAERHAALFNACLPANKQS